MNTECCNVFGNNKVPLSAKFACLNSNPFVDSMLRLLNRGLQENYMEGVYKQTF